ncbi:hypothetical protein F3Y22_tig00002511pilonHSYRG00410 [Hibiscus syriacus]|uniref:RNase H type-1 domain-containing protein n=1 Tax=Hibiscus syriacus TaxID=106335 RepID=A0A6A3CTG6_HIBSY|nr:hypothetical protein F3Y22_tig00002511pilonHSYRG00410 [Hibiscus syriacus]
MDQYWKEADTFKRSALAETCLEHKIRMKPPAQTQRVTVWSRPLLGWHRINTDASCNPSDGSSKCGGILRNHEEEWIMGFHKYIDICSVLEAKLWGASIGMKMAWELGFTKSRWN